MCGICGLVRLQAGAASVSRTELGVLGSALAHRGPDGAGEWYSPCGGFALGHRRLAILDLSANGSQPMADPSGRFRIVFNGEIYNFRELRSALASAGELFATASDTEVVLRLWAREGRRALSRLRGMYAFALYDAVDRSVTLVRDPFGIKPLYYSVEDGTLRFASQVKALEACGVSKELDPGGVVGFLLWGSVPEPGTIRRAIRAVPAGQTIEIRDGRVGDPIPIAAPQRRGAPPSVAEALAGSVRAHLVSDVPVALFLSAGLDSTLLAALAAREGPANALTTFTLTFEGWEGEGGDEGRLAAATAAVLGTRHIHRRIARAELESVWEPAIAAMDQPSIDGFNTFLVARAAHEEGIKVALSGLGGDELFGSYPSFRDVPRWRRQVAAWRAIPGAARLLRNAPRFLIHNRPKLRGMLRYGSTLPGAYFLRRGLFLPEELPGLIGRDLALAGLAEHDPVEHAAGAMREQRTADSESTDAWLAVQQMERSLYLRNQLLRDGDWATMASSLELRVPLVDVELWEDLGAVGCEPARTRGKGALARAVAPELPAELFARPKSGFAVPVADWICPPRRGEPATPGAGSRRLALRVLEEWGLCPAR